MKNAVIRPQAMIAPMFGMIMLDKKVPNLWTCTRRDAFGASDCVTVAMLHPLPGQPAGRLADRAARRLPDVMHVMRICDYLYIGPETPSSRPQSNMFTDKTRQPVIASAATRRSDQEEDHEGTALLRT
jgi:hypothetical protein